MITEDNKRDSKKLAVKLLKDELKKKKSELKKMRYSREAYSSVVVTEEMITEKLEDIVAFEDVIETVERALGFKRPLNEK